MDRSGLVSVLRGVVLGLEADLRARADEVPEVGGVVEGEWESARAAGRTDVSLGVWRDGLFTQVAVGWVLASVFVRFCEDNGLIAAPLLTGSGGRRRMAEDSQTAFFREHPSEGDRGYLLHVFETAARLPGLAEVLGSHSPVWLFGPCDDACRGLLDLWRKVDPESGDLVWDFTDPDWDTRFLGDLYQDLSESARKQFALLQTPDFVEEFILDRTLEPALDEFGLVGFRMIDPACGSGHFLLGAFERLVERWRARDPSLGDRALAARALDSIFGVDLNPSAVAIARFRLLVAALKAAGVKTLAEAPAFSLNVAAGDSLLHGPPPGQLSMRVIDNEDPATRHLFATEDGELVSQILSQQYHAVVANPPYIRPKDPAANAAYRRRYQTCHMQYALTVPFMERLFDLAVRGGPSEAAGFVGQITANSFMKREFGKKVIEDFLATEIDLTHVIDLGSLRLPGHTTPTVILLARNCTPVVPTSRVVLGIRGERPQPPDLRAGRVWTSILSLVDRPGSESPFISVADLARDVLSSHPWSLRGGGALDLKLLIDKRSDRKIEEISSVVGHTGQTNADEAMLAPREAFLRRGVEERVIRELVVGHAIRDWFMEAGEFTLFPYDGHGLVDIESIPGTLRWLWPARTTVGSRRTFAKRTYFEEGRPWWEWHQISLERMRAKAVIAFAAVASHNHFVFDDQGKVFNRSAPFILLSGDSNEDDHLAVLASVNSSIACFWMKQMYQPKPNPADDLWEMRYDIDSTKLRTFGLPPGSVSGWARALATYSHSLLATSPRAVALKGQVSRSVLDRARDNASVTQHAMVSTQEELDWRCYFLYGLTLDDLSLPAGEAPSIGKGERAFEIALARRMAAGEAQSTWFERHGSTAIIDLPTHWSDAYKALVEQRLGLIESDRFINLLERPEYKRRWDWADWDALEHDALQRWLLDRLEAEALWSAGRPKSVAEMADRVRVDAEFMRVAELYAKSPEVHVATLVGELVIQEAVPYLAAWRYTDKGIRKRLEWEATWALQRREDAGEDVGVIPVPPKYAKADFRSGVSWSLRGKLDVPKERFISYPGLNRDTDGTLLVGWAGWDHLEQATALAGVYEQRRTVDGWDAGRLVPVLAGIDELVPWVIQWHNDPDPASGQRLGDFFDTFVAAECNALGIPRTDLTTWQPPIKTKKRRKRKTSTS